MKDESRKGERIIEMEIEEFKAFMALVKEAVKLLETMEGRLSREEGR